jgi:hypothetical protein
MAFLLILVAKFFGPSSSAPEGGPRGCLMGWLAILWLTGKGIHCSSCTEGAGLPIPSPSYNFLDASSRGERDISLEEEERGVVGDEVDPADFDEPEPVE